MDAQQQITDRVIEMLETANANGFQQPWITTNSGVASPINVISRKSYSALNGLFLWLSAEARGYTSGEWGTFRQWRERGATVRKGEKGTAIHGWFKVIGKANDAETDSADDGSDGEGRSRLVCRTYFVFNASQVDGYEQVTVSLPSLTERLDAAEIFFQHLTIPTEHGGNRAYYSPVLDAIRLPLREQFNGTTTSTATEAYYSTRAHEAAHATGHKSRLARDLSGRFGSEAYAMEELVAELTAIFVCIELGISATPRADHADYLASWLRVLRNDKRAITTAASQAKKALEWMQAQQPQEVKELEKLAA